MKIENFVRNTNSLTYLVVRKASIEYLLNDQKIDSELDEIENKMLKNELNFIDLELELINLELKRESILLDN